MHRLIGAALAEIKHLYQDQGTQTESLDVLKLHHGEEVQLEYPGDEDALPYEPGAELTEIPVQIMQGETDVEKMDSTEMQRERLLDVEQPPPRGIANEGGNYNSQSGAREERVEDEADRAGRVEMPPESMNQWENSERVEVELVKEVPTNGRTARTQGSSRVKEAPTNGRTART